MNKKTTYRYSVQMMPLSKDYQNDDLCFYFPNIYEIIMLSEPFEDYIECFNTCNLFLEDKLSEINNSSNKQYGIIWEYNPRYKFIISDNIIDNYLIEHTKNWNLTDLLKFYIVKLSSLKGKRKRFESFLMSTIIVEPGEIGSLYVH
jgi:hypothetical protein